MVTESTSADRDGVKSSEPPVPVKSHTVVVPYPRGAAEQPAEVQKASLSACIVSRREIVRTWILIYIHPKHQIVLLLCDNMPLH